MYLAQSTNRGTLSRSNWNLEVLGFERDKLECIEKNLSKQGRELTTNSTFILCD